MAIDLMFKVPLLLRILIAIEKGARHFEFDFEMIFFSRFVVCLDSPVVVALLAAPEEKLMSTTKFTIKFCQSTFFKSI